MPARPLLLLVLWVSAGPLSAQPTMLRRLIERGRHPAMRWGHFGDVQAEAESLYARNGWVPLWTARGRPTPAAHALLDALATVGDRGLDPEDYDAAQLTALAATLDRRGADAEQAVRFDAALTVGALRLVLALERGRLPPPTQGRFTITRSVPHPAVTVAALRESVNPGPLLSSLEPAWSYYLALKRALSRYRALGRDSALARLTRPPKGGLPQGGRYAGAAALRRLLAALGDLGPRAGEPRAGDSVYSAELAEGIRRFQVREGEHVDGLLTEATWRALTTHWPRRIRQMALALERWRWLPRDLSGEPLLVSVPALRLHYLAPLSATESLAVHLSVRVGTACVPALPVFATQVTKLWFAPLAPAPGKVEFLPSGSGPLYLHGATPDDFFAQGSGAECIRVADGQLLAMVLLRGRPDWDARRIRAAMAGPKPAYVRLPRPVSVLVVYATALARDNGQVFFYPDRDGLDQRLERQLAAGYPYR